MTNELVKKQKDEERQNSYLATLQIALNEYDEIAIEVKRLGKRISSLRRAIQGLSELAGKSLPIEEFGIGNGISVVTNETRALIRNKNR